MFDNTYITMVVCDGLGNGGLYEGCRMLIVARDILYSPCYTAFFGRLAHLAVRVLAYFARKGQAAIGMYKEFYGRPKVAFYHVFQLLHFSMTFIYVEIPRYSKMAIKV